ncbi:hypothetical protein Sn250709_207 [Synechococcus phage S-RIM2]|jgi:hypothetical protein|uniref:PA14 domain-containing protein n=3 Tax=Caudoviricetes TaxID=2731619 RepID=A0A1D7RU19_9CAUD|nr:hypothetical protein SWRG_00190 [Synechococcus phage S-RIM2 R21_2007]AON98147.1 hypothetical protein Fa240709_207 [Synechococcus phage S-RIM2]AON98577.1 hypothetical protein LIS021013_208 [Synechococcus phage S-RIM2]AON99221.1 hypothetical protein LIS111010_207 [Synechococcus phage S-RIM2]AON99650.1 hypothetical protein LIS141013_207 [Synechococcus phage S-RIM2]
MSFYYPEGYFGPICDSPAEEQRDRTIIVPEGDKYVPVFSEPSNWWYGIGNLIGEPPKVLVTMECKQKPDGTYFDCRYIYSNGDVEENNNLKGGIDATDFGLRDVFFVPTLDAESCSPFDEDINIRPRTYYLNDGTAVTKAQRARSKPLTYAVDAGPKFGLAANNLTVAFNSAGTAIVTTGSGRANVNLRMKWDDNPNTAGVAVNQITITDDTGTSTTWTRSGEKGSQEKYISVVGGATYNLQFSGLNSSNNPIDVQNNGLKLCLTDSDDNDCNVEFFINEITNPEFTYDEYQWNSDGRNYGVWTNPEVCTLAGNEQEVTYVINIEQTGTYAFSFGSDNRGSVILNTTDILFNDVIGGIFTTGAYTVPYTTTRTLNRGQITVTVSCLNLELPPPGDSYDWNQNPGGWFLKICRGSACGISTEIADWIYSGPTHLWSDFMNTYAVFPSNTNTYVGQAQSTVWNIDVPATDNYTLEVQADNTATITLDGATVATSTSFTSSTLYTLSNLAVGPHTIGATVTNNALGGTNVDSWSNNPAGVAWTITRNASSTTAPVSTTSTVNNAIEAQFNNSGDIVVTGIGTGQIQLLFKWDDNPNQYDTALGKLKIAGKTFVQTAGKEKGSDDYVFTATAGQTYNLVIDDNSGGFTREGNSRLCFRDKDGNDCNAELLINDVTNSGTTQNTTTENVTTTVTEGIIASSLDLSTSSGVDSSNIIWHTRKAIGYEEYIV